MVQDDPKQLPTVYANCDVEQMQFTSVLFAQTLSIVAPMYERKTYAWQPTTVAALEMQVLTHSGRAFWADTSCATRATATKENLIVDVNMMVVK